VLDFIELGLSIEHNTKKYTSVAHVRNKQLCTVENKTNHLYWLRVCVFVCVQVLLHVCVCVRVRVRVSMCAGAAACVCPRSYINVQCNCHCRWHRVDSAADRNQRTRNDGESYTMRRYARVGSSCGPLSVSLCLSIRLKLVFCQSGRTDRAGFKHGDLLRPILQCVVMKLRYLQKCGYFPLELCPELGT